MKPKVAIMFLSYERTEMAYSLLSHNLLNAGSDMFELMITDQGTVDRDWLSNLEKEFSPSYMRKNTWNEGISRSLNQMMLRRSAPHALFLPNDFKLSPGWLKRSLEYLDEVGNAGVVGFDWQTEMILPTIKVAGKSGKEIEIQCEQSLTLDGSQVLGATFFTEKLIDTIGYIDEDLSPYGFEDQMYCFRAKVAGFNNFYMPDVSASHLGLESTLSPYKSQKEMHLLNNVGYFKWKARNIYKTGVYVSAPPKRETFDFA